ncbi:acetate--CoA ligase family protein [Variovorax saccharolyticus]|uniref:acetate--CoA ligase family protein n=1 Tax=Variovorax saccharolyticus TaxID=3053516 RepID=UPI002578D4D8|nr:acetate--CoA ligase family protein [Variovorax sp. J22R187]MDM0019042.1 acetate--CoA ligase family protein [Variovorax sp. J22R187]
MQLDALFSPRSVAVIGASQNPQKVGGMPVQLLLRLGYDGPIYPVNPGAAEVQGLTAFATIDAVPAPIDLAIVALPAASVEGAIEQLIARRARAAVVLSSGFAEMGEEGAATQARIAERALASGMALLGPNCLGVMNIRRKLFATFSPAPLAGVPEVGQVAIVSQSGAFGAYAFSLARKGGLGLSHWVTTGNEAAVSVADVIDWLADDAGTRVILAYIEGARDGAALQRALAKARAAGKPVIVTKVGRTEAGARAAMSHTASLSGEDALYQAVFDATGAIRARTVDEMFRLGQAFATGSTPAGRRLGIVTVSGGVGTLMADSASDLGLELPALPENVAMPLRERIPFCATQNPIDVTGQVTADLPVLGLAAQGAATSGAYDALALFVAAALASPLLAPSIVEMVRKAVAAAPGVPMALCGIADEATRQALLECGCLVFEEPTHAVEVLAAKARWAAHRIEPQPQQPAQLDIAPALLNEAEALDFLGGFGVPAAPHRWVHSPADAVAAWRTLGGEAVMKIVSADLLHKSDVGGVRVGLRSEQEIREAYEGITGAVARLAPQARQQGVLVARKLSPLAELMLGARHDPVFGTVLVLGLGGVQVELHPRSAVLTAPTTAERVRAQLDALGVLKLIGGWRGRPKGDADALVDVVLRFGSLAAALGPRLGTLEINPLMVTAEGIAAADAVVSFVEEAR